MTEAERTLTLIDDYIAALVLHIFPTLFFFLSFTSKCMLGHLCPTVFTLFISISFYSLFLSSLNVLPVPFSLHSPLIPSPLLALPYVPYLMLSPIHPLTFSPPANLESKQENGLPFLSPSTSKDNSTGGTGGGIESAAIGGALVGSLYQDHKRLAEVFRYFDLDNRYVRTDLCTDG